MAQSWGKNQSRFPTPCWGGGAVLQKPRETGSPPTGPRDDGAQLAAVKAALRVTGTCSPPLWGASACLYSGSWQVKTPNTHSCSDWFRVTCGPGWSNQSDSRMGAKAPPGPWPPT